MTDYKLKAFIIATLRRASYRHPGRTEAFKAARIERNQYKCAHCSGIFTRKEIQIDHILPVVDPAVGFVGFDSYIERMFCGATGLQVLCKPCHTVKTSSERAVKKNTRGSKKLKKT